MTVLERVVRAIFQFTDHRIFQSNPVEEMEILKIHLQCGSGNLRLHTSPPATPTPIPLPPLQDLSRMEPFGFRRTVFKCGENPLGVGHGVVLRAGRRRCSKVLHTPEK